MVILTFSDEEIVPIRVARSRPIFLIEDSDIFWIHEKKENSEALKQGEWVKFCDLARR
jgi:hypothetical protein